MRYFSITDSAFCQYLLVTIFLDTYPDRAIPGDLKFWIWYDSLQFMTKFARHILIPIHFPNPDRAFGRFALPDSISLSNPRESSIVTRHNNLGYSKQSSHYSIFKI